MKECDHFVTRVATLIIAAIILTGCGGGGGDSDNSSPTGSTSNRAPTISGTPGGSVVVGQAYSFTPTASDADGDVLTFSIQNKPPWASFDTTNGNLSGAPSQGDEGAYSNISISVSDGSNSASLSAFTVNVNQVGMGSVTLSWTPPTQNEDGTTLADLTAYKFYYGTSPGDYPNQVRIDNPGLTSYVIDNLSPNTYYFVATAINSSDRESSFSNEATKTVL